MTFDLYALYSDIRQIETYLGYLKGNELAYEYLQSAVQATTGTPAQPGEGVYPVFLEDGYKLPCPDGRWQVEPPKAFFQFMVKGPVAPEDPPPINAFDWIKEVQHGADQAYRNGTTWASGIADYAISLCEQFAKPDAVALDAAARSMKTKVVDELSVTSGADWAGIEGLLSDWHGAAKAEFDPFYRNVMGLLQTYATFAAYTYAGTCAATQIIDRTQTGAQKFVDSMQKQVVEQLDKWMEQMIPPRDTPKTPAWVADVVRIGKDAYQLLDLVPVVSEVKGNVDKGISAVQSIEDIAVTLGMDPPQKEPPFDAKDAEELYTGLTKTLSEDYLRDFKAAMDAKAHGTLAPDRGLDGATPFSGDGVLKLLHERMRLYGWNLEPVGTGSLYSNDSQYRF